MKYTDYQNEYPLATDYLNRVREADERVQWLRERANNMRMCLTDSSAKMTHTPHGGSADQQKILTILAEVDEMQEKIAEAEVAAEEDAEMDEWTVMLICDRQRRIGLRFSGTGRR